MNPCPSGDGNTCPDGQALCPACADRLWQELYWLADMYPNLQQALTHRLDIERVDRDKVVIVAGGKDPTEHGVQLHEDALQLRAEIRQATYAALAQMMERGLDIPPGTSTSVPRSLAFVARNLIWLLTDPDLDRVVKIASRVVVARTSAEHLVTPQPGIRKVDLRMICQQPRCGGRLVMWAGDQQATCLNNPAHVVSRETLVLRATYERAERIKTHNPRSQQ